MVRVASVYGSIRYRATTATPAVNSAGSNGIHSRPCASSSTPARAPISVPPSTIASRRRSTRVPDQSVASPASTAHVAVAAVVKTACTPRATAVAVWMPIASAEIASSTTVIVEPGSPPTASQTIQNASCTNAAPSSPTVTRAGQSTVGATRGINLAVTKAPAPNAHTATAACKAKPESCEDSPTAMNTTLPVMKAENTFPSASQVSASTEPAASASAARSASRTR